MELRKGWLQRQMANVHRDVKQWPDWMKRAAEFKEDGVQAGKDGCTCYDETTRVCGVHRGEAWGQTIGQLDALAEGYWLDREMRGVKVDAHGQVAFNDVWAALSHGPRKNNLIGLVGRMGSGKDAVAALLHMRGYVRHAFADAVREEVDSILAGTFPILNTPKDKWLLYTNARIEDVWAKPTTPSMRKLLQFHGTEFRRGYDKDYWINKLSPKLVGTCVVSDVRFPNEVALIRAKGGVIWRVRREGLADVSDHVSETHGDHVLEDAVIENNGTLYDLADRVMERLG